MYVCIDIYICIYIYIYIYMPSCRFLQTYRDQTTLSPLRERSRCCRGCPSRPRCLPISSMLPSSLENGKYSAQAS